MGLDKRELDLYNPHFQIAIEYDGNCFSHRDKPWKDCAKDDLCHSIGIQVLRIREFGLPIYTGSADYVIYMTENSQNGIGIQTAIIKAMKLLAQKMSKEHEIEAINFVEIGVEARRRLNLGKNLCNGGAMI